MGLCGHRPTSYNINTTRCIWASTVLDAVIEFTWKAQLVHQCKGKKRQQPATMHLTRQERSALTAFNRKETITILPADKGRCIGVLITVNYHLKVILLLEDQHAYEKLKRPHQQLHEKEKATHCLYGLPKRHKDGVPPYPSLAAFTLLYFT